LIYLVSKISSALLTFTGCSRSPKYIELCYHLPLETCNLTNPSVGKIQSVVHLMTEEQTWESEHRLPLCHTWNSCQVLIFHSSRSPILAALCSYVSPLLPVWVTIFSICFTYLHSCWPTLSYLPHNSWTSLPDGYIFWECVIRQTHHCAIIVCTYTNLDDIGQSLHEAFSFILAVQDWNSGPHIW
jgi:hypothetical protein